MAASMWPVTICTCGRFKLIYIAFIYAFSSKRHREMAIHKRRRYFIKVKWFRLQFHSYALMNMIACSTELQNSALYTTLSENVTSTYESAIMKCNGRKRRNSRSVIRFAKFVTLYMHIMCAILLSWTRQSLHKDLLNI